MTSLIPRLREAKGTAGKLRANYRSNGLVVFYAFLAGCALGHSGATVTFFIAAGFAVAIPLIDAALIVWRDHELAKLAILTAKEKANVD